MAIRRDRIGHGLTAVRVTGALLPPDFLQTIAGLEATKQSGSDYGLSKSLVLKDEIARYWRIANDLYVAYAERRQRTDLDAHVTGVNDWLVPLFRDVLGYSDISPCDAIELDSRLYPITHLAVGNTVPLLLTIRDFSVDRADPRFGQEGRRRAPYGVVQELLNADDTRIWGFVANGTTLRLLRDNPTLTRPSYIEADLERIFDEQLYADFSTLWLTLHASRVRPIDGQTPDCILDSWRDQAHETGERALEHLRDGVTTALRELGNGFLRHPDNESLRAALASGGLTSDSYFEELLRLVYRLLFLFAAEDRHLLHAPTASDEQRAIYRDGYSVSRLRDRALRRRHYDRHADLWQSLTVVFSLLAGGAVPLGLPALGGLFSPDQCAALDAASISNEDLLEAIRALAFFRTDGILARVNYRDMGTEELGSVYESLLELHPFIDVNTAPWVFGFVGQDNNDRAIASARKLSGSYYTPAALVNQLIASTLEPVMLSAVKRRPDAPRAALLDLKVIDPACGSGHFLLAAAHRIAGEIARLEAGSDVPDEAARQHALREVVQHCIYGVDRNPLAVELCKTALWIETIEPGKPLTFLDPHIRCGDSLVGVLDPSEIAEGIPDAACVPLTGDDKATCRDLKKRNRESAEAIQGNLFDQQIFRTVSSRKRAFEDLPEDTLEEIAAKRAAWTVAQGDIGLEKLRADLYVAAFFAPKTKETVDIAPINEDLRRLRHGMSMRPGVEALVQDLAQRHRFFHWHVAFPDIMQRGGFDVLLGNPPWERIKLQEKEFFEQRSPTIANALNKTERERLIRALVSEHALPAERSLHRAFEEAKHESEASANFVRGGGRFPLSAVGDVNTYAVFTETFLGLMSQYGRAGFIVPAGIATDATTSRLFRELVDRRVLRKLVSFENEEFIFQAVHHAYRFSLVTIGADHDTPAVFSFFLRQPHQIADERRQFMLSPDEITILNPKTRTAPVFRSRADAELTMRIYNRLPILVNDAQGKAGNPWSIQFGTMFHMANDSAQFRTASQLDSLGARRDGTSWVQEEDDLWLPLYEAKMLHQYDHRWASYEPNGTTFRDVTNSEKSDPAFEPLPRYWVAKGDVDARLEAADWEHNWLIGFRDVTGIEKIRTVIASALPRVAVGHSMPLLLPKEGSSSHHACLIANLCSLTLDYVARQKVGGVHLTFFYLMQLPVLPPTTYGPADLEYISSRVLELTYTSTSMESFARALGYSGPPFSWDPDRRAWLRAELDAYYAHAYGLTRDELRYILDPSDVLGADYPSETFRVLKQAEVREFGEYRTARLTLKAWDQLEEQHESLREARLA